MAKKKQNSVDATTYKLSEIDSIFAMVKTKEGIIICCGKFRVSQKTFKTFDDAEEYIASKPYELLINVCVLFSKLNNDENENTKETAKDAASN